MRSCMLLTVVFASALAMAGTRIAVHPQALAAARSGVRTVLVNDRPYLGGNASREIRIWCAGEGFSQPIIRSLRGYFYNGDVGAWTGDDRRLALLSREDNLDLRLSTRAFGVTKTADGRIASVKAIDWKRNRVIEIRADLFLDATGDGWIGAYAGADWRMGRDRQVLVADRPALRRREAGHRLPDALHVGDFAA